MQDSEIPSVSQYKYLEIVIDDSLTFKPQQLVKKLKVTLGFYLRNKSCFSFEAKRRFDAATFMSVLDYGDVPYMHESSQHVKAKISKLSLTPALSNVA